MLSRDFWIGIVGGYESWRKASRYARTAGRQADTLEGHRPDARTTPAADIETISLQKIVNLGMRTRLCNSTSCSVFIVYKIIIISLINK